MGGDPSAVLPRMLIAGLLLHCASSPARAGAIFEENLLPGSTAWMLFRRDPARLEAFASAAGVAVGETIQFYVSTPAPQFRVDVYRLGWYGGPGGRLYASAGPLAGRVQPPCDFEPRSRMRSCSNWVPSWSLTVPPGWLSGAYWAKFTELDGGFETAVLFVVRNDDSPAALLVQIPFATYQAYNPWGGKSLYEFNSTDDDRNGLGDRAYKVSFDRPYQEPLTQLVQYEYQALRWLEREGFDVTYTTSLDSHARPELALRHKAWITLGHDEYWSRETRDGLEQALRRGVHLGFFGGNLGYWQVRFEDSPLGSNRVMVCYRSALLDPNSADPTRITVAFRDPPVNRPENSLIGVMYGDRVRYGDPLYDWVVSGADHWVFEGTSLRNGDRIPGVVGYEFDAVAGNGLSPAGLAVLSRSPVCGLPGPCNRFSNSTIYQASSGAWVFAAGTIQWGWLLDSFRPWCGTQCPDSTDPRLARITANVLRRFQEDAPARLQVSETVLRFETAAGRRPPARPVAVSSVGKVPIGWRARVTGADWLRVSPSAGLTPSALTVAVDPSGLAPGEYRASVVVETPLGVAAPDTPAGVEVTLRVEAPAVSASGIVDGAAFSPGRPVAPGSLVSLFGSGLAPAALAASATPLPLRLGSTEVLVNGTPAPLFFVSPGQINFQFPFDTAGPSAAVRVRVAGTPSAEARVEVAPQAPVIFLAPAVSPSAGAVLNPDGSLNAPENPAPAAAVIQIFATGLGAVEPALESGRPAPADGPLLRAAAPVSALVAGREAEVLFAGPAPGLVGVYQVNVRLPADLAAGAVPLSLRAGEALSNTVTVVVE